MGLDERSKAMYQPWNQEGFNADLRVRRMTNVQRWIYKSLLQEAFVCSTRPRLPDNDEELWIMADCDDINQWLEHRPVIIKMFELISEDGVPLLLHRRLEEDWDRLVEKRTNTSTARSEAAKARWSKRKQIDANQCKSIQDHANDAKEVKEVSKESEASEEKESPACDLELSEGTDMKAKDEIQAICLSTLGVKAEGYESLWQEVKLLEKAFGGMSVVNTFREWAEENVGETFQGKPVSAFVKLAPGLLHGIFSASKDSKVADLAFELSYIAENTVTFPEQQKGALAKLLKEYTSEELIAAFKEFYGQLEKDSAYAMRVAGKNFTETADQFVRVARRKRQEREKEQQAVEATRERLEKEAEDERRRILEKRKEEESMIEEELSAD